MHLKLFSFFKERWTISEFTVKCGGTLSFLAQTDRHREIHAL
jgi:hypothetical protein